MQNIILAAATEMFVARTMGGEIMKARKIIRRTKETDGVSNQGAVSGKAGAKPAAGSAAYREDYLSDHGPDLDEPLDKTESGHEF
jgi:hypothetical protein